VSTPRGTVALPDGARLCVEEAGRGAALVLVHGFGLDARCWAPQVAAFAATHRVIVPELRGYGRSPLPDGPYAHADDLGALLDALGVTRATLVGVSLGASVVTGLALARPALAAGLVLVSPLLRGTPTPGLMALLKGIWQLAADRGVEAARAAWRESALFAPTRRYPEAACALQAMLADYHGWHWTHRDPERAPDPPPAARLAALRCPVQVVTGAHDLADFHATARLLADAVPGARAVSIEGAGHLPQLEQPAHFDAAMRAFFDATASAHARC
jgi:3-oxoadipate enol-lactonase